MSAISTLTRCDVDFALMDAMDNAQLSLSKRLVAGLCVGVPVEDAYLSANELFDALVSVKDLRDGAKESLLQILCNRHCDDLQRALYYALAGRGIEPMIDTLRWLVHVLGVRRRAKAWALHGDVPLIERPAPYVSDRPDGVLPAFDPHFVQGPSWEASRVQR